MRAFLTRTLFALGAVLAVAAPARAEDADAYYKQGLAYKNEGKTDEAIKSLQQAVDKNPKHGMAWASLGNLYKTKGDIPKAVDAYEHAVQFLKKDAVVWSN